MSYLVQLARGQRISGAYLRNRSAETVWICSVMTQPPPEATWTRCIQPRRSTLVNGKTRGHGCAARAGNATIVAFVTVRHVLSPTQFTRACLLLDGAAGVLMTADQDGHGLGILIGVGVALLVLLRRWARAARHPRRPLRRVTATVAGVWLRTTLTWVCWVRLLGVDLIVATPNGGRHAVGWLSVAVVAVLSGLGACAGLRLVQAGRRKGQLLPWTGLCLGVTLVSLPARYRKRSGRTASPPHQPAPGLGHVSLRPRTPHSLTEGRQSRMTASHDDRAIGELHDQPVS